MSTDLSLLNRDQSTPLSAYNNEDMADKNTPVTPSQENISHMRPSPTPRSRSSESFAGSRSTSLRRPHISRSPDTLSRLEALKNENDLKSNNMNGSVGNLTKTGGVGSDLGTSSTENVSSTKRLVEQFYKMDGKSKPSRSAEGSRVNGNPFGGPLEKSPGPGFGRDLSRDLARGSRDTSRTTSANDFGSACVEIEPFDQNLLIETGALDVISHIDNHRAGYELEYVTQLMREAASALEREPGFHEPLPSGQKQLLRVEKYLNDVQDSVKQIISELGDSISGAKAQYSEQTQKSMAKVTKLSELLQTLSERVEKAKAKLANSRNVLSGEIGEKIAVLEHVSARFETYNRETRSRRVRQISVGLALAAVLVGVYMAVKGIEWGNLSQK